jgi:glutaredoxin
MKRIAILSALAILSAAPAGAAELYRWVDEKGNVEYRDTPPPPSAKKVERRNIPTVQSSHVTLWNSDCGAACEQGRAYLNRRGVPFVEMDPLKDVDAFKRLTGGTEVPVLFVGASRITGFNEKVWEAALDSAGYGRNVSPGAKPAARGPIARTSQGDLPPVKLYTHPECGTPCADARLLLTSREVAFEEVLALEPQVLDELQKVAGDVRVPVLLVGEVVTRGFSTSDYHRALDAAGFRRPAPPAAKP